MWKRTGKAPLFTFLACGLLISGSARAQDAPAALPRVGSAPAEHQVKVNRLPVEHRFWDRTNIELFAGVAAVRALDYASTRHFRARGANEVLLSNSVVDNKPLFAGIEVAATAASIGVSYLFHRTGHHKLERWVSIVHIGVGGFGDARNYTLGRSGPSP